jgi:hypothetical protein
MCAACVFSFYRFTVSCSAPHEFALMQINNVLDRLTGVSNALPRRREAVEAIKVAY